LVTDTITLRGLSIDGAGTGIVGVRILRGGGVFIENLQIFGQSGTGISDTRTAGGQLFVENSIIRDNNSTGIVIIPSTGSTPIEASIKNVRIVGNGNSGLAAGAGTHVTLTNSVLSGNVNYGVYVEQPAGATQLFLSDSTISGNQTGIVIGSGAPLVRLSNNLITDNDVGLNPNGITVYSFGNNRINGNAAGNGPFSPPIFVIGQQ
jgi:hypothetical protein